MATSKLKSKRITVTDSATLIHRNTGTRWEHLTLFIPSGDLGSASIDLGGENVASGEGFALDDGVRFPFHLSPGQSVYGVASALDSVPVHVMVS